MGYDSDNIMRYMQNVMDDPLKFTELFLGIEVHDYNKSFLIDQSKYVIYKTGRQVGKSLMCAAKALHKALRYEKQQIMIIAPTQDLAQHILWKVKDALQESQFASIIGGRHSLISRETQYTIEFSNGSKIMSRTAGFEGKTNRGFTPNMIIYDEAAYGPERSFVTLIPSLLTTLSQGGQLIYVSTPFGKSGAFYEAWVDSHSIGWSRHEAKSVDNPLATQETINMFKSSMTEAEYQQEILGEFTDEGDSYFGKDLVNRCIAEKISMTRKQDREYYMGVDVARYGRDETVYLILEVTPKSRKGTVVDMITETKNALTHTVGRIKALDAEWGFERIYLDSTTLGAGAYDMLTEEIDHIEEVVFSLSSKADIYHNLKLQMEQDNIKIPYDVKMINQLTGLQAKYTANNIMKIQPADPRMHDDRADALALAVMSLEDTYGGAILLDNGGLSLFT